MPSWPSWSCSGTIRARVSVDGPCELLSGKLSGIAVGARGNNDALGCGNGTKDPGEPAAIGSTPYDECKGDYDYAKDGRLDKLCSMGTGIDRNSATHPYFWIGARGGGTRAADD